MALPANDKVIGDLGHTDDHNAIVDEISSIKSTFLSGSVADSVYLRQDTASATYLTQNDASNTYLTISSSSSFDIVGSASAAEFNAKAYTDTEISDLINAAPPVLDTLKELADALGNDPNFAASTASAIGDRLTKAAASATYLSISDANNTYFPISSSGQLLTETEAAGIYLRQDSASSIYLTQNDASNTYLPISASATLSPIGYLTASAAADIYAPLDSPSLIGTPTAPTASAGTNNSQIATTEFVSDAIFVVTSASSGSTEDVANTLVLRDTERSFDISRIDFNTSASIGSGLNPGELIWNNEEGTLDLGMSGSVIQSVGMEFYMPPTKNDSGVEIPNGAFVMATGAQGDRITIAKAVTDGSIDPMFMIGVATDTIPIGSENGLITTNGIVRDINTASYTVGTVLYPDPNNPGGFTDTKPDAPAIRTAIAIVLRQQQNSGRIYVRMTNGSVLGGTDSNVNITSLSNEDILIYNQSASYWQNQNVVSTVDGIVSGSYAAIDSPNLTGIPTAPTASAGTNTEQIATTEFVTTAVIQAQTGSATNLSDYLRKDSASAIYAEKIIDILSSSSSYTLSYNDINRLINISSTSPTILTVPNNSSVPFPIGTKIDILQSGTGQVSASPESGVVINGSPGLKLSEQWAAATILKLDTDSWVMIGNITS